MNFPSIENIRSSFLHGPAVYKLGSNPSRDRVRNVRKKVLGNLQDQTCLISGADGSFGFVVQTDNMWREKQLSLLGIDEDDAAAVEAAVIPPKPNPVNPGELVVGEWSHIEFVRQEKRYNTLRENFLWLRNIEKAVNLDLKVAIPAELISDLMNDDGDIQSRPLQILDFLETRYNQMQPKDIKEIMDEFNKSFDDTITSSQYFARQQNCRTKLKHTNESIRTATAVRTCLGHFQAVAYLGKACDDWDDEVRIMADPATWTQFKTHFTKCFLQYHNKQETLKDAGIANVALTEDDVSSIITSQLSLQDGHLSAAFAEKEAQIQALSAQVDELSNSRSSPKQLSPSPSTTTDQSAMAAVLATMNKKIDSLSNGTGGEGKGKKKRTRTKRRYQNDNYCWTHGCDLSESHTSKNCNYRREGHVEDATLRDRKGGSSKWISLVLPDEET